jgi:hypothetical protein
MKNTLIFVAEGFQKNAVGEGALAFLGPLMFSWGVIPAPGLIRVMVRAAKQGTSFYGELSV